MIKRSLVWLYSVSTFLLWAVIIVMATVVLGLRYYVLPNIQQHKDSIALKVSEAAGQKITIGNIKASWDGMHPRLDLYQVDLYDAQDRPALTLAHIETSLSWLSLPLAEPRLSKLVIHKPELSVRREADGTLYVAGISMSGPARPEFPNWLLRQARVDILDARVIWQDDLRQAPPLELRELSLSLVSPAWESFIGKHRFGLRAKPAVGSSGPIEIRGNLSGRDVSRLSEWSGTLYARTEGTQLADWRPWVSYPADLSQGFGAAQLWIEFSESRIDAITADVLLNNMRSGFGRLTQEITLQNLAGRLQWKRLDSGSEMRAKHIRLTSGGLQMKDGELRLTERKVNGRQRIEGELQLDDVGLEPLAAFAGTLPLAPEIADALQQAAPRGGLQRLQLAWQTDAGQLSRYTLRSRFNQLGIQAFGKIPGFTNVSGSIDASQDGGTLNLDAANSVITAPETLRWPVPVDQLSGQLNWKTDRDRLEVKVNNLALASTHFAGTFNASYRRQGSATGEIDMAGRISRADGKFALFYYPKQLSKDTLHWLDTSVLAGTASDVSIEVRGNLDQFPWADGKNGLFRISGKVKDGLVDYATGWPQLDKLDVDLLFQGNRMELKATRGQLFGNRITRAKAVIPVLDAPHPVLLVNGELNSPAGEAIRYVNNSPVLKAIDGFTEGMRAVGEGRLRLDLEIPLDTEGEGSKIKGSYLVRNGSLTAGGDFPDLTGVSGLLEFTESSFNAENVSTRILGGPATLDLHSEEDGALRVQARGRLTDSGLRLAVDSPLAARLHGATDWNGEILLRKGEADFTLRSSLAGMSSSLPPPFGKGSEEIQPVLIEKKQLSDDRDSIHLSVGKLLDARILRKTQQGKLSLERAEIGFGVTAQMPGKPGIHLGGEIETLDLDQWNQVISEQSSGIATDRSLPVTADLSFGVLDVLGRRINNLKLNASSTASGWRLGMQSRELVGDAIWQSAGHGKVIARLRNLTSPAMAPAKLSAAENSPSRQIDYPALDIVAEQFEIRQKKLGRLELQAVNRGKDWLIEKLLISNPESTLEANGEWRNWKSNPNTRLTLIWNIQDIGKTLERFGHADIIKGGSADLSGFLLWPGSPHDFDLTELSGNLTLDARTVQVLKIKPGVGRLLGVLSLQNLPRRLVFDFRDVFSAGFTFDKVTSGLLIERGMMKSDDFMMEGPAARVNINGETDLKRETQNLRIKVTPLISDSISLAAFAGGPAVGVAALLAQKLLKDPLNKLATYEFEIGGTWDDPQEIKRQDVKPPPASPIPRN